MTASDALSLVHSTAVIRAAGRNPDAWRDIAGAAQTIRWLVRVPFGPFAALPANMSDADAASKCSRLLCDVRVDGHRGNAKVHVLEIVDAAVKALGGTPYTGQKTTDA